MKFMGFKKVQLFEIIPFEHIFKLIEQKINLRYNIKKSKNIFNDLESIFNESLNKIHYKDGYNMIRKLFASKLSSGQIEGLFLNKNDDISQFVHGFLQCTEPHNEVPQEKTYRWLFEMFNFCLVDISQAENKLKSSHKKYESNLIKLCMIFIFYFIEDENYVRNIIRSQFKKEGVLLKNNLHFSLRNNVVFQQEIDDYKKTMGQQDQKDTTVEFVRQNFRNIVSERNIEPSENTLEQNDDGYHLNTIRNNLENNENRLIESNTPPNLTLFGGSTVLSPNELNNIFLSSTNDGHSNISVSNNDITFQNNSNNSDFLNISNAFNNNNELQNSNVNATNNNEFDFNSNPVNNFFDESVTHGRTSHSNTVKFLLDTDDIEKKNKISYTVPLKCINKLSFIQVKTVKMLISNFKKTRKFFIITILSNIILNFKTLATFCTDSEFINILIWSVNQNIGVDERLWIVTFLIILVNSQKNEDIGKKIITIIKKQLKDILEIENNNILNKNSYKKQIFLKNKYTNYSQFDNLNANFINIQDKTGIRNLLKNISKVKVSNDKTVFYSCVSQNTNSDYKFIALSQIPPTKRKFTDTVYCKFLDVEKTQNMDNKNSNDSEFSEEDFLSKIKKQYDDSNHLIKKNNIDTRKKLKSTFLRKNYYKNITISNVFNTLILFLNSGFSFPKILCECTICKIVDKTINNRIFIDGEDEEVSNFNNFDDRIVSQSINSPTDINLNTPDISNNNYSQSNRSSDSNINLLDTTLTIDENTQTNELFNPDMQPLNQNLQNNSLLLSRGNNNIEVASHSDLHSNNYIHINESSESIINNIPLVRHQDNLTENIYNLSSQMGNGNENIDSLNYVDNEPNDLSSQTSSSHHLSRTLGRLNIRSYKLYQIKNDPIFKAIKSEKLDELALDIIEKKQDDFAIMFLNEYTRNFCGSENDISSSESSVSSNYTNESYNSANLNACIPVSDDIQDNFTKKEINLFDPLERWETEYILFFGENKRQGYLFKEKKSDTPIPNQNSENINLNFTGLDRNDNLLGLDDEWNAVRNSIDDGDSYEFGDFMIDNSLEYENDNVDTSDIIEESDDFSTFL
ncbi:hypothetical protein EDEG_00930 [Edhazardia aedis USNM 41457]|uniref:Uncharacterized protein n=1 Tax=Edhazardia aedis (strain USNM 41457) TaxID=1003232 RepID=J9DUG3_EDHAE|nr:hypothetical protein EDEG_00930 [Edhazardia aedis USNM 41457]|eukprot:EJW04937.1 hypothetical protein EDEG_00930 [Edhazardia aedis USNM 41457]